MTLSAPKKWTFMIGVVLWVLGLLWMLFSPGPSPVLNIGYGFWLGMLGGLVLILGCAMDGF